MQKEYVMNAMWVFAVIIFAISFWWRSYRAYLDVSIEPSWFTPGMRRITKKGWAALIVGSVVEAAGITTSATIVFWLLCMVLIAI